MRNNRITGLTRTALGPAALGAVLLGAAACGTGPADPGGTSPPAATSWPDTTRPDTTRPGTASVPPRVPPPPGGPPKTPTDLIPTDEFGGRVVRGGDGPCYGVVTDDGELFAVYSRTPYRLRVGDTVLVRYEPLRLKIDCGEGRPVSAVELEVVR
jgi:hypothetical protein